MKQSNRSPKVSIYEFDGNKQSNLFNTLKYPRFTGELIFGSLHGEEWIFHFYLGRIVYATGGEHRIRRWLRNVKKIAPNLINKLSVIESELLSNKNFQKHWEYELLTYWLNHGLVGRQYFSRIIRHIVVEILFDIAQKREIFFQLSENQSLANPLVFINPTQVITQASEIWEQWKEAKLNDLSPNHSPVIINSEKMKKLSSKKNYLTMPKLFFEPDQPFFGQNQLFFGQNTIRDLSIYLNQDLISTTRSILPYVERGLMQLISIPDLSCPIQFAS